MGHRITGRSPARLRKRGTRLARRRARALPLSGTPRHTCRAVRAIRYAGQGAHTGISQGPGGRTRQKPGHLQGDHKSGLGRYRRNTGPNRQGNLPLAGRADDIPENSVRGHDGGHSHQPDIQPEHLWPILRDLEGSNGPPGEQRPHHGDAEREDDQRPARPYIPGCEKGIHGRNQPLGAEDNQNRRSLQPRLDGQSRNTIDDTLQRQGIGGKKRSVHRKAAPRRGHGMETAQAPAAGPKRGCGRYTVPWNAWMAQCDAERGYAGR